MSETEPEEGGDIYPEYGSGFESTENLPEFEPQPDQNQQAAIGQIEAAPNNFRFVSQVYADQLSLFRRTVTAIDATFAEIEAAGQSRLFDFSKDSLKSLIATDYSGTIIEYHARVVDLLVFSALGQDIDVGEYQEYAKLLVTLYPTFDFIGKMKTTVVKNPLLLELEQEWLKGNDFTRVQEFFRAGTVGVEYAAKYCGMTIAPLPEF